MLDGYCWPQSVLPGENVDLHVSSSGPFGVEVAREGGVREILWRADAVLGTEHPVPATASADQTTSRVAPSRATSTPKGPEDDTWRATSPPGSTL